MGAAFYLMIGHKKTASMIAGRLCGKKPNGCEPLDDRGLQSL